jgi:hypothetical protein
MKNELRDADWIGRVIRPRLARWRLVNFAPSSLDGNGAATSILAFEISARTRGAHPVR